MKRNRNIGRTVVYPHILEGVRKELQDHAGHELELQTKLHQVSNAPMNSNFQRPFPPTVSSVSILAQEAAIAMFRSQMFGRGGVGGC